MPITPESTMKNLITPMMLSVSLLIISTGLALAVDVHKAPGGPATGQPSQSIRSPATGSAVPGNSTSFSKSTGSPFGQTAELGTGSATANYAGAKPLPNGNLKNSKAVSQYDVAGFQQSHKPNP